MKEVRLKEYYIWGILLMVIVFYIPFMSRQFVSDDWLWLANAKAALNNPSLIFERPMYGYFRPLNLVWVLILFQIFGIKAYAFSFINICLHTLNVLFLGKVLLRFGLNKSARYIALIFFAFYYLNISAIGWISVGHDLWVLLLSFLFILKMMEFTATPRITLYMQALLLGICATFFKEAGLVTVGMYFLIIPLEGRNPFSRSFIAYSVIIVVLFCLYVLVYFSTRTVIDKEVSLGVGVIINLWYFLAYLLTPFSARVVGSIPENFYWMLKLLKLCAVITVPAVLVYIIKVKGKMAIFFIVMSVMFLSTVAVFDWHLRLLDLYPEMTISRFMYLAVPGMAVIIGWLVDRIYNRFVKKPLGAYLIIPLVIFFIASQWIIVGKVTVLFFHNQSQCNQIIDDLESIVPLLADKKSLIVLTDNYEHTPQIIYREVYLEAILLVEYDLDKQVKVKQLPADYTDDNLKSEDELITLWITSTDRLQLAPRIN